MRVDGRVFAAVVAAAMLAAAPQSASGWLGPHAREEDRGPGSGPLDKLGRGLANIITSPAELVRTPQAVAADEGWGRGATAGVAYGMWRTVLRAVVGVFEVATFYAEVPKDYGPLIQPEFVFERPEVTRR